MPKLYDAHGREVWTRRNHKCDRTHRKYRALAKCLCPNAQFEDDDREGPYAFIAWVDRWPTIVLCDTLEVAQEWQRMYWENMGRYKPRRNKIDRLILTDPNGRAIRHTPDPDSPAAQGPGFGWHF
ncbi:hypothetical protein G352_10307 [Rhodococcus ruber BKS 20-38]|uniref:Uncharacterized protein n=1 Tax=Rhodococcus ruber BKS 20-38 TaxID=1278076 RepID=M2XWL4_9NOCA|nr:hypothetical protein [Rhodococcus ruber]EME65371.1 hypothetical protein G352_10307 [Rhodococcus ruber BKS 20-38]